MTGKKEPPKKKTTTRDYTKYAYLTIALDRDGIAYQGILGDATKVNSKHYPTIAALRLTDYYEMKKSGTFYRVGTEEQSVDMEPKSTEKEADNRVKLDKVASDANADEAAELW